PPVRGPEPARATFSDVADEGRSHRPETPAPLAQLAEQLALNQRFGVRVPDGAPSPQVRAPGVFSCRRHVAPLLPSDAAAATAHHGRSAYDPDVFCNTREWPNGNRPHRHAGRPFR